MRKYIFAALTSFMFFSLGFADNENIKNIQISIEKDKNNYKNKPFSGRVVENSQAIVSNYLNNDEWIMGLADGSFWKLHVLKNKRKQTWIEWWKNITPEEWALGDEFFFEPDSWKDNVIINVYTAEKSLFPKCFHVLENQNTKQKVFAEFIPFGARYIPSLAFADRFFEHSYNGDVKLASTIVEKSYFLNNLAILEDNSCWKIFPFKKNDLSWWQWFKGEKTDQPDEAFVFALSEWEPNDDLQMYFLQDDERAHAKYYQGKKASKFDKKGIFLIENKTKSHLVYAQKIALKEIVQAFDQYAKKSWDEGYFLGYKKGYNKGISEEAFRNKKENEFTNEKSYENGYIDGYQKGFAEKKLSEEEREGNEEDSSSPPYNPFYVPEPSAPPPDE